MSLDTLKSLYDNVALDYNIGSYEEFKKKLEDEDKRKSFYDAVSKEYNLSDYDKFSNKVTRLITPNPEDVLPGDSSSFSDGTQEIKNPPPKITEVEDSSIETGDADALLHNQIKKNEDEQSFKDWYANASETYGIDPDPKNPENFYDYEAAWRAGVEPETIEKPSGEIEYKWPSQFKHDNHPNRFLVEGNNIIDTKNNVVGDIDEYSNQILEDYDFNKEEMGNFDSLLRAEGFESAHSYLDKVLYAKLGGQELKNWEESSIFDLAQDATRIVGNVFGYMAGMSTYGYKEALPGFARYLKTGKIPELPSLEEHMNKTIGLDVLGSQVGFSTDKIKLLGLEFGGLETGAMDNLANLMAVPFEKLDDVAEWAGSSTAELDFNGSHTIGAVVESGIKSIPWLFPYLKGKYNARVMRKTGLDPRWKTRIFKKQQSASKTNVDVNLGDMKQSLKNLSSKERKIAIKEMAKDLKMSEAKLIEHMNKGTTINVDFARTVVMTDRPWYRNLKKKISQTKEKIVAKGLEITGQKARIKNKNINGNGIDYSLGIKISNKTAKKIYEKGMEINGEPIVPNKAQTKQHRATLQLDKPNAKPLTKTPDISPAQVVAEAPKVSPEQLVTAGNQTTVPPSIAEQAKLRIQERQQKAELDAKTKQKNIIEEQIDLEEVATGKPSKLRDVSKSIDKDIKKLETPKPKVKSAKKPITKTQVAIADKAVKDKPIVVKEKPKVETEFKKIENTTGEYKGTVNGKEYEIARNTNDGSWYVQKINGKTTRTANQTDNFLGFNKDAAIEKLKSSPIYNKTVKTPKVETSPVPLKSGKWTKIQGKSDVGEAMHGISVKGKDYFVQKKPTGSGGKFEIHQVDLNGKSLGVIGKNFNQAMSKIKSQARESAPKIVKPRPKLTGNKKMDASILKEDIEIQKTKDFLDKNSQKLSSLQDVQIRGRIRDLEAQKEFKIESFEQAAKTAKMQERSIEKLKLRIKEDKYKKSDDKYFDKNELKQREIDLKNAKIIMNRFIDYKPKRVMQDGMYVYSSIIPPIPPVITNFIKDRIKQFKTKPFTSGQLKDIVKGFKGNTPNPVNLPLPENIYSTAKKVLVDAHRNKKFQINEAQRNSNKWRKLDENIRKDVGAAVERIGRLDIGKDTYAKIMERWTPEHRKLMQEYQISIEKQRRMINKELSKLNDSQYIWFLENYLPHIYTNPNKTKKFIHSWKKNSPNFKKRKYPTLKEAMDAGLKPLTQDVAFLHDAWVSTNWNVLATRQVIDYLAGMKSPDGGPLIRPVSKAPQNWPTTDHPIFSSIDRIAAYDPQISGIISVVKGYKYSEIPKNVGGFDLSKNPITNYFVGRSPMRLYDTINNLSKSFLLGISGFHYFPLMESYYGRVGISGSKNKGSFSMPAPLMLLNNFTNGRLFGKFKQGEFTKVRNRFNELMDDPNFRKDVANSGLEYSHGSVDYGGNAVIAGLMKIEAMFEQSKYLKFGGKPIKGVKWAFEKMNSKLWDELHTPMKVVVWNDCCNVITHKFPNENTKVVQEKMADIINSNFGGLEWNNIEIMSNPNIRKWMMRMWLSPDWTLSALRNFYGAGTKLTPSTQRLIEKVSNKSGGSQKQYGNKETGFSYGTPKWADAVQGSYMARIAAFLGYQTAATQFLIWQMADDEEKKNMEPFFWNNEEDGKLSADVTPIVHMWQKATGNYDPLDKQRHYISYGKQVTEVFNYADSDERSKMLYNKLAGPLRTMSEQVTGFSLNNKEYMLDFAKAEKFESDYIAWKKRALHIVGTSYKPFSLSDGSNWFFPAKKGITYTKAVENFTALFTTYAFEEDWNNIIDGHPDFLSEQNYWQLYPEVVKACEANGIDWEKAFETAMNGNRQHYMQESINAAAEENWDEAQRYADMAAIFGVGWPSIEKKLIQKTGIKYIDEMNSIWDRAYTKSNKIIGTE